MKKLIGIAALVAATGMSIRCSTDIDAISAAQQSGWRNVQVVNQEYFLNLTCGEGEMAYRIRGENPRGDVTSATVCCGYTSVKGCTIRY